MRSLASGECSKLSRFHIGHRVLNMLFSVRWDPLHACCGLGLFALVLAKIHNCMLYPVFLKCALCIFFLVNIKVLPCQVLSNLNPLVFQRNIMAPMTFPGLSCALLSLRQCQCY